MKKLRVTVDGKTFEVVVESVEDTGRLIGYPALPVLQQSAVAPPSSSSASKPVSAAAPGDVVSPLAGRIVSVDCEIGQKVTAGDKLVTVEAMKMNTFVNAAGDGTVSEIVVKPGDAVEEGQVLVKVS